MLLRFFGMFHDNIIPSPSHASSLYLVLMRTCSPHIPNLAQSFDRPLINTSSQVPYRTYLVIGCVHMSRHHALYPQFVMGPEQLGSVIILPITPCPDLFLNNTPAFYCFITIPIPHFSFQSYQDSSKQTCSTQTTKLHNHFTTI